jgi:uncharacterized protein YfaP (DUF2135 family)
VGPQAPTTGWLWAGKKNQDTHQNINYPVYQAYPGHPDSDKKQNKRFNCPFLQIIIY